MAKKIIGICGLIGNGKDTAAGFLIEEGYERISFAGVLKDVCASLFGWDRILLEGNTPESRAFRERPDEWWSKRLGIENFTPRYALQNIGTNVFREHFHKDIWVAAAERRIMATDKNVVISDARFFNELQSIKNLGGELAAVWRNETPVWWPNAVQTNTTEPDNEYIIYDEGVHMEVAYPEVHPSEWSWAGWDFDHELSNNSTLNAFKQETLNKLLR